MLRFIRSKKGIALLATLVVVAVAAVGAYAYFTNSGSTVGTPVTGATVGPTTWTVAYGTTAYACHNPADTGCNALAPAPSLTDPSSPVATVPFTVTNNDASDEALTSYTIKLSGSNTDAGGDPACNSSDFAVNGAAYTAPVKVTAGGLPTTLSPASDSPNNVYHGSFTVQMVENNANQDSCEGWTPTIEVDATS
jgi:hypothetical protein